MAAIAHSPAFAKKVGVPQSVGKDFNEADKGKTFKRGGEMKKMESMKEDIKQDKAIVKKAFAMHDKQEHKGGKGTDLAKLKKGGMPMKKMNDGGGAYIGSRLNMPSNTRMGKLSPSDTRSLNEADSSEYGKELAAARKEGIVPRMTKEARLGITSNAGDTMPGSEYKKGGNVKKMASGGMAKESMGSRTMSKDVEKGSNTKLKHGEHGIQKKGHTRAMMPKMKGKTI